MTTTDFDYYLFGTHVVFGDGVSHSLAKELRDMGLGRPVVLTQARMAASGKYASLRATLAGLSLLEICTVPQHSSVSLIETIKEQVLTFDPDCIVAIGGGSVSDSAKALAMLLAEGGKLADHATVFTAASAVIVPHRNRPKLPIITIPTTASGAEATPSFGISDGHEKILFWNRSLASRSILIDPTLNEDVPLPLMHYTAMNGIAHCLEGLYSRNKLLVSTGLALQAMSLFIDALANESLSEPEQRRTLLLAGHVSGMVLSMARSCLHHAICHVIGARHGLGHGAINTVMLPHTIRFNESAVSNDLSPVLDLINGQSARRVDSVSEWLSQLIQTLSLPNRLSAYGLTEQDLDAIASSTMKERGLAFNPLPVKDVSQIKTILRNAL